MLPIAIVVTALAVLVSLGAWQLERRVWKERLIETLTQRLSAPPVALPPPEEWSRLDPENYEYRRVRFRAEFLPDKDALLWASISGMRDDVRPPGFFAFTPARLPSGGVVVVNRGFLRDARPTGASARPAAAPGIVEVVGVLRWPEPKPWFLTAPFSKKDRLWFIRDQHAMAAEHGWGEVAPFYIERETQVPPDGLPAAGPFKPNLPNNHLHYALTWFGLAAVLAVIFAIWLRGRRRETAKGVGE
jgi:surfeit locus 1 family protein